MVMIKMTRMIISKRGRATGLVQVEIVSEEDPWTWIGWWFQNSFARGVFGDGSF